MSDLLATGAAQGWWPSYVPPKSPNCVCISPAPRHVRPQGRARTTKANGYQSQDRLHVIDPNHHLTTECQNVRQTAQDRQLADRRFWAGFEGWASGEQVGKVLHDGGEDKGQEGLQEEC